MLKRLIRTKPAMAAASFLITVYIRLIVWTSQRRIVGKEHLVGAAAGGKGVILAFWHGRMLLAATVRDVVDSRMYMLVSVHRDGEIITNAVKPFGIDFIRGSAANPKKRERDKSGASATAQMIAALNNGDAVGFTPDGPRGPAEKVKIGLVKLAQLSGAPILPVAFSSSRGWRLKSWDRFLLSLPFSRCRHVAAPAVWVAPDSDDEALETAREQVERALKDVCRQADLLAERNDTEKG